MMASAAAALSSVASGYYYWTFFPNHSNSFVPVQAKYDLSVLPSKTVSYFISDQGPSAFMPGDSLPALVSQIRAAAAVWDGVASSDLRLKFGGISTVGAPQSAPGIDIIFDDNIPPGIYAQTRLTLPNDLSGVAAGTQQFVPIQRATIQFYKNLNAAGQASYQDFFFTTLVHELGHALGLQHTLTSAVMSTGPTRGTSKAQPLAADDIAGISLLYPAAGWLATTGAIQGRVVLQSSGVNMASVVALSTNGTVVSTLSNPDGSYKIAGLPMGQYYVYAHPLPSPQQGEVSPANIVYPVDTQHNPFPANIQFDTQFFPGTRDWTQATQLSVTTPGGLLDGINFSMQKRSGPAMYAVTTYGYLGAAQVPVAEPPLPVGTRINLVMQGPGIAQSGKVTPGLNITGIGGAASTEPGTLKYYTYYDNYDYIYMTVDANPVQSATPVALAFTTPNDLFVLPAALSVVPTAPPVVSSVIATTDSQGNPLAVISGSNLKSDRIVFDGAPASVQSAASDGSSVTVAVPPALGAYNAVVTALAGDGQSSTQELGPSAPPILNYPPQDNQFIWLDQTNLAAGTDMAVTISGSNLNFVDGQVAVGFGSSDIVVRKVWVNNKGSLRLNVSVSSQAQPGQVTVTVVSGLQLITLTGSVQVTPFSSGTMTLRAPVTNAATGLAGVPAGGTAVIGTSGLPANLSGWTLTIGGATAGFTVNGSNLMALVPPGLAAGVVQVQLTAPGGGGPAPILMQIDGPPPTITAVTNAAGQPVDNAHAAQVGDTITMGVAGLTESFSQSQLRITIAGVPQNVQSVTTTGQVGSFVVTFVLSSQTPPGAQQVNVILDTLESAGYPINIRPSDNSQQTHR